MVLMALDHTRDFFTNAPFAPIDLTRTNSPYFLTRWITHFCAPVFFFLAGTGAFLGGARGKTKRELSRFLLTRGLWLMLLDVTLISWCGWRFDFSVHEFYSVVIWALGCCMVVLAGLVWLPVWAVTTFGVAMIALHNTLDGVTNESWGRWAGAWQVLHTGGSFDLTPGITFSVIYPLIRGWG